MIIHLGREAEAQLRERGFEIPMYPIAGDVIFDSIKVGYIDNFSGLTVRDECDGVVRLLVALQDEIKMGLWNVPQYAR